MLTTELEFMNQNTHTDTETESDDHDLLTVTKNCRDFRVTTESIIIIIIARQGHLLCDSATCEKVVSNA